MPFEINVRGLLKHFGQDYSFQKVRIAAPK